MEQKRLTGEQVISKLYDEAGKQRINNVSVISDKLANQLVYSIGMTYGCDILEPKIRSTITIATHIVLGDTVGIKVHYGNALKAGLTVDEIKQIILHSMLYSGAVRAEQAFIHLKELMDS